VQQQRTITEEVEQVCKYSELLREAAAQQAVRLELQRQWHLAANGGNSHHAASNYDALQAGAPAEKLLPRCPPVLAVSLSMFSIGLLLGWSGW